MPADRVGMAAPTADVSARRRFDLALIVLILGAALRVWSWARGRSLWLDEQMIAMNIRDRDLLHLSGKLDHEQSAPLGWLWAEKIATSTALATLSYWCLRPRGRHSGTTRMAGSALST